MSSMRRAVYFEPEKISPDEQFKFISNDVVHDIQYHRYIISTEGRIYDTILNKLVAQNYDRKGFKNDGTPKGYLYAKVKCNNDRKNVRINRIVALSFSDNLEDDIKKECNHKDGNHSNNKLSNLEMITTKENKKHAYENKLYPNGENVHCALLSNEQAEEICKLLEKGTMKQIDIAELYNIDPNIVANIKRGHSYRHISEKYSFMQNRTFLSNDDILNIANMLIEGNSAEKISNVLNVSKRTVLKVKNKQYKIVSDYNFPIIDKDKEKLIRNICNDLENNDSISAISKRYNISKKFIRRIIYNHSYDYISKDYNISSRAKPRKISD